MRVSGTVDHDHDSASNRTTAYSSTRRPHRHPLAPSIAWAAPGPIVYGTALGSGQLDASANVPGTFSYTPAAGTILGAGSHTLSVTFTPSDTIDYTTATATTTITVMRGHPDGQR